MNIFDWLYEAADKLQYAALKAEWIDRTYDLSAVISWAVIACIAATALAIAMAMKGGRK